MPSTIIASTILTSPLLDHIVGGSVIQCNPTWFSILQCKTACLSYPSGTKESKSILIKLIQVYVHNLFQRSVSAITVVQICDHLESNCLIDFTATLSKIFLRFKQYWFWHHVSLHVCLISSSHTHLCSCSGIITFDKHLYNSPIITSDFFSTQHLDLLFTENVTSKLWKW